jgi:predicted transcriptional regulator
MNIQYQLGQDKRKCAKFVTQEKQNLLRTQSSIFVGIMNRSLENTIGPTPRIGRVRERFGVVADAGFQPLPDMLIFHQADLGLSSEELNVLLNILAHWYDSERMPYPRVSTIAKRMGVSERTVQRSLSRLRTRGFLQKASGDGVRVPISYDPNPLVEKLKPYAENWLILRWNARKDKSLEDEF